MTREAQNDAKQMTAKQMTYRFLNSISNSKTGIFLFVLVMMLSSCGVKRDVVVMPSHMRLSRAELDQYSRRLGMPLSGNENPLLVREVASWMGTPYRYGGNTRAGADCSGFVWSVYREVYNHQLPRTTRSMFTETRRIRKHRLREGDLVFFRMKGRKASHVGIYLGNGHFAHASTSRGVIVNELNESYYLRRFTRGGRVRL